VEIELATLGSLEIGCWPRAVCLQLLIEADMGEVVQKE
jgi:hypothetical protein